MYKTRTALLVVSAAALIATGAAQPQQSTQTATAHHVTCFLTAIGPFKANSASITHIQYGFKVSCTPDAPEHRHLEVTLWRHDLQRDKYYMQDTRTFLDTSKAEDGAIYASECSAANILYGFHTQAVLWGEHGDSVDTSSDSDEILLAC